jgi:hypothetical protein
VGLILSFCERCEVGGVLVPGKNDFIWLIDGTRIPAQPVRIIREASLEEWKDGIIAHGGTLTSPAGAFFYEVESD